jgi:hypothetical protein
MVSENNKFGNKAFFCRPVNIVTKAPALSRNEAKRLCLFNDRSDSSVVVAFVEDKPLGFDAKLVRASRMLWLTR